MNRLTQLRQNVLDALAALPALAGLPIKAIAAPNDIWGAFAQGTGIGVARRGVNWDVKSHDLNYYVDQPATVLFDVVIKTDCPVENADGLTGEGQAEDIEAAILTMRPISIGILGTTGDVYLTPGSERVVLHPLRAEGGAGPVAIIVSFQTTTLPI